MYAEYLAEATLAPIFMLRRGAYKYISSTHDPKLLFNVDDDPHELNNLAEDPTLADRVAGFEEEIQAKWNAAALTERIVTSQKRRRFVLAAQRKSLPHSDNPLLPARAFQRLQVKSARRQKN